MPFSDSISDCKVEMDLPLSLEEMEAGRASSGEGATSEEMVKIPKENAELNQSLQAFSRLAIGPLPSSSHGAIPASDGTATNDHSNDDLTIEVCNDIWTHIILSLGDPVDVIHMTSVSHYFNNLVIKNGVLQMLCQKRFPQLCKISRIDKSKVFLQSMGSRSNFFQDHKVFSNLLWLIHTSDMMDCIFSGICASSTNRFPEESIAHTLGPKLPLLGRKFWCSAGLREPSMKSTLVYQLISKFCIVEEILIEEKSDLTISSHIKSITVRMGHEKIAHEFSDLPSRTTLDDEFEWTCITNASQISQGKQTRFKLPKPSLCIGGFIQVELCGFVQQKESDGLFYSEIYMVKVLGRPLWIYDIEVIDPSGTFILKACKLLPSFFSCNHHGHVSRSSLNMCICLQIDVATKCVVQNKLSLYVDVHYVRKIDVLQKRLEVSSTNWFLASYCGRNEEPFIVFPENCK